jgi:hypothetical protein
METDTHQVGSEDLDEKNATHGCVEKRGDNEDSASGG